MTTTLNTQHEAHVQKERLGLLLALNRSGKHIYEGTVPAHVKAKRRAKNKAARAARKAAR